MLSKLKSWLNKQFPDQRILICDACGTARIYNWQVKEGVEVDFRYEGGETIVALNFNEFIEYIDCKTTATNIEEFLLDRTSF